MPGPRPFLDSLYHQFRRYEALTRPFGRPYKFDRVNPSFERCLPNSVAGRGYAPALTFSSVVIEMCSILRSPHPNGDGSGAIPRSVPPNRRRRQIPLLANSNRQTGRYLSVFAKLANFSAYAGAPAH